MAREYLRQDIWRDTEGTNYVMLDVTDHVPRPKSMVVDGVKLYQKDEYHVTLVPTTQLTQDAEAMEVIIEEVRQYISVADVGFVGLGSDYYHCQKDGEHTVIVSAQVTGLEGLSELIKLKYPDYQPAFPHVTLLKSQNSKYGIGVSSSAQLAERCKLIEAPLELMP